MKTDRAGWSGALAAAPIVFLVALAAIAQAVMVWGLPARGLLSLVEDDAFYYFKIARNAAHGHWFTFDTINETNGFHPLWGFVCYIVYKLVPGLYTGLRAVLTVNILLWVGASAALWFAVRSRGAAWAAAAVVLFTAVTVQMSTYQSGMETGLFETLWLLLFLFVRLRDPLRSRGRAPCDALFGLLLLLVILARIDGILLLPGVALAVAAIHWKDGAGRILGRWVSVFAVTVAGLVAYALLNKQLFDVFLPISGMLKSTFPHVHVVREYVFRYWWAEAAALIALAANIWIAVRARSVREDGRASESDLALLFAFNTYCILHMLNTLVFTKARGAYNWYFHPYILTVILDFVMIGSWVLGDEWLRDRRMRPVRVTAIVLALLLLVVPARRLYRGITGQLPAKWRTYCYDAALWARSSTPPDTVFAMNDAGVFGYFSDRRVVNLDGLVNSLEYQRYGAEGRLDDFLKKCGARYLVQANFSPEQETVYKKDGEIHFTIMCALHDRPAGLVRLSSDRQVFQSEQYDQWGWVGDKPQLIPSRVRVWELDLPE
jgi:hypothetical protein